MSEGTVGVSIVAGHIYATDLPPNPRIGQQVSMGADQSFMLHITPLIAKQWISVLTNIANEGSK